MVSCRSLWHISKTESRIINGEIVSNPNLLLLRTLFSFVSLGTERLISTGRVPMEAASNMTVPHMAGDFDFPVKYGYSLVGEVLEGPNEYLGKKVHVMHPHQDYCVVSPETATVLPEFLPPKRASLISNTETAVNALWDGDVQNGQKILIIGFGSIGALIARLITMETDATVDIFEIDEMRRREVSRCGFNLANEIIGEYETVFNCSGNENGLNVAIKAVGLEGKVIECSWYGKGKVTIDLGAHFHFNRVRIISSQVSHIPKTKQGEWDYYKRKQWVLKLLENEDFDKHLSHEIPFENAPELFEDIRANKAHGIGYCLKY